MIFVPLCAESGPAQRIIHAERRHRIHALGFLMDLILNLQNKLVFFRVFPPLGQGVAKAVRAVGVAVFDKIDPIGIHLPGEVIVLARKRTPAACQRVIGKEQLAAVERPGVVLAGDAGIKLIQIAGSPLPCLQRAKEVQSRSHAVKGSALEQFLHVFIGAHRAQGAELSLFVAITSGKGIVLRQRFGQHTAAHAGKHLHLAAVVAGKNRDAVMTIVQIGGERRFHQHNMIHHRGKAEAPPLAARLCKHRLSGQSARLLQRGNAQFVKELYALLLSRLQAAAAQEPSLGVGELGGHGG